MERRESFEVRVPIEVAFDFFSDPSQAFERRAPQFRVRWEGSIGSGSTFAIDGPNPKDRTEGVVDAYEPPRRFVARMWLTRDPQLGGTISLTFAATPEGTLVSATSSTRMGALAELVTRVGWLILAIPARRGRNALVRGLEAEFARQGEPSGPSIT